MTLIVADDAAPRTRFGAERLERALAEVGYEVSHAGGLDAAPPGRRIVIGDARSDAAIAGLLPAAGADEAEPLGEEEFLIANAADGAIVVAGGDASGALYGSLELAGRTRAAGELPGTIDLREAPDFRLRGPSIGMQKLELLPGREIYDYPYTPELFPFFYDKEHWRKYLDMLVENRMNTLYLWNGHPFASLVKLEKYPYAVEVSDEVFAQNVEMFDYITEEADRRGIWVIQMFYNIYVSKPFAEHHGIGMIHAEPDPLTSDYNRLSIAKFVEQYPNVGLLVCLGEALIGQENQQEWLNEVVIPGVKLGLERLGKSPGGTPANDHEPPIVIRAHSVEDPHALIQGALPLYENLYTMAKYNGESLTTHEPRGKWVDIHNALAETGGTHVANVHILANLEPFRYGATEFIRKSMLAIRDVDLAAGLHLYPLSFWDWPVSPDKTDPLLEQMERDWIWYEAWARYAWDADRDPAADREYWIGRLSAKYGSEEAAGHIYDAYNAAGEVAPRLLRWFGITEGNRQTLSLGMTLDQLVDPYAYTTYPELWESHAPPGERLDTYLAREHEGEPHEGETPPEVIAEVEAFAADAVAAIEAAAPHVADDAAEFERLANDIRAIRAMAEFYGDKVRAAMAVLQYGYSEDAADMQAALAHLEASVGHFRELEALTRDTYRYANSLQTSHRKIPFRGADDEGRGRDYHWSQVLPYYEDELDEFRERVAALEPAASGAAAAGGH
ncbi:MAG TPA: hypothetical protein VFY03_02155 [Woeseiaceae bacterium]|nr:hypothetical protein [Woeseiaceae bacterium]